MRVRHSSDIFWCHTRIVPRDDKGVCMTATSYCHRSFWNKSMQQELQNPFPCLLNLKSRPVIWIPSPSTPIHYDSHEDFIFNGDLAVSISKSAWDNLDSPSTEITAPSDVLRPPLRRSPYHLRWGYPDALEGRPHPWRGRRGVYTMHVVSLVFVKTIENAKHTVISTDTHWSRWIYKIHSKYSIIWLTWLFAYIIYWYRIGAYWVISCYIGSLYIKRYCMTSYRCILI